MTGNHSSTDLPGHDLLDCLSCFGTRFLVMTGPVNRSHCGVDIFNIVRMNDGWRIASMAWSADQPPICQPHPDGPVPVPVE